MQTSIARTEAFVSPVAQRQQQIELILDEVFPRVDGDTDSATRMFARQDVTANDAPRIRAHVNENWLVLEVALAGPTVESASWWKIVQLETALPAPVKLILSRSRHYGPLVPCLRADLAIDAKGDLSGRVLEVSEALATALTLCARAGLARHEHGIAALSDTLQTALNSTSGDESFDLHELVGEAGWNYIERSPDQGVVDLVVPGDFRQAEVTVCGQGVRLAVYLPHANDFDRDDVVALEALAKFLLRAAGWVRAVRPALGVPIDEDQQSGSPRPCFELVLTSPLCADDVGRALAALAVAARWCVPAAEALQSDSRLAAAYLGAVSAETSGQTERNKPTTLKEKIKR
jgi:hypothetical protein